MSASQVCPEPARLQQLLEGDLPPNQQVELTSHLDTCSNCQKTLENLAGGSKGWPGSASEFVQEQPEQDAALKQLMHNLKQKASEAVTQIGPSTSAEARLEFLGPPQKPGHLGSIDQYQVTELIGRGGMGIVLKAFDPGLHRFVDVKVLAPHLAASETARERFKREARAAAAVSHEHVVAIYHVAEFNGLPFFVMEYVRGLSLQQRLEQTGPLKLKEILRIGMQIASGLAAAHAQGLVHRDIKPANILLENGVERVKITDFGLARAANDASLTQSGVVAGTPHYMAPEQARGETVDHRADLFSLGTVLYSLCTGRVPFQADTVVAVLYNVCQETPRLIQDLNPGIPDWLVQIIAKLHAKDKTERYQSAAEVAELLGKHLAHLQEPSLVPMPIHKSAADPNRRDRGRSAAGKRRRWALAAAVLVIVLGGLGLTDALGVTDVTDLLATTLRIRTPRGTLVVDINDPNIKVAVKGEGEEITITGGGIHELRVIAGSHVLWATQEGRPVDLEMITISRGDKKLLKIKQEGQETVAKAGSNTTSNVRAFKAGEKTITQDGVRWDQNGLRIESEGPRTVRLFEVRDPGVEDCLVTYRARMKSNLSQGRAYLEMWCQFPGFGKFFSKGLQNPLHGVTDWASYETPFFLKKGQRSDLIELNVVIEGKGIVWLKDIEVILRTPWNPRFLEESRARPSTPTTELSASGKKKMARLRGGNIKTFSPPDKPISQDGLSVDQGGWKIESQAARTIRLFEVTPGAGLEQCMVLYRAKMKTEKAEGRVYLEMWCRVPGIGEAFSKGFDTAVTGTADWKSYEIPFRLEKGQQADLIKLNVVAEGKGTIWVKDVELSRSPLP